MSVCHAIVGLCIVTERSASDVSRVVAHLPLEDSGASCTAVQEHEVFLALPARNMILQTLTQGMGSIDRQRRRMGNILYLQHVQVM